MTKIIVEMKGFGNSGQVEGIFTRIEPASSYSSEGILLDRGEDCFSKCPTQHVLRYWFKGRWVYISHEPKRKRPMN